MGIRHSCVPRSAKFMVIVRHLYRPLLVFVGFFASIMDLVEDKAEEDLKTLSVNIPVLSEYAKALDKQVKERYLEKISVVGVDPVSIPSEQFDAECLPQIEATDSLGYLVLETSYYTRQQFKAYKSLEAFNQMVSGFVTSVRGCKISNKHVVVTRVRHSQRMNDPLVNIGIIAELTRVLQLLLNRPTVLRWPGSYLPRVFLGHYK